MDTHLYNVEVTWNEERKGMMCSPELTTPVGEKGCIEVATPPQFPKGIPGIWSPEHLLTAAVGSCLMTTFLAIAENSKLEFTAFSCKSQGRLEKIDGKLLMTKVDLEPHVTIEHEKDRDKALRILEKSEAACLISNSINATVTVKPTILVA